MPFANESDATAQAAHAHTVFTAGAYGLAVQTDHDARVVLANATHTTLTNAQLATNIGVVTAHPWGSVKSFAGAYTVTVAANRAGVDLSPEDAQGTEDLEGDVLVGAAVSGDRLFTSGGFIGASYTGSYSPYYDPLWAAEASKQTAEKLF